MQYYSRDWVSKHRESFNLDELTTAGTAVRPDAVRGLYLWGISDEVVNSLEALIVLHR